VSHHFKIFAANVSLAEASKEVDLNANCELMPNHANVMKFCQSVVQLQKKLQSDALLDSLMTKFHDFKSTLEGNDNEALSNLLQESLDTMKSDDAHDHQVNVLHMRKAFLSLTLPNGKAVFDLFELLYVAILITDRECMNTLEVDDEYFKSEFMDMPCLHDIHADELLDFKKKAHVRINRRIKLATQVFDMSNHYKQIGKAFDITNQEAWKYARFTHIATALKTQFQANPQALQKFKSVC
jgi:hypothetical protein